MLTISSLAHVFVSGSSKSVRVDYDVTARVDWTASCKNIKMRRYESGKHFLLHIYNTRQVLKFHLISTAD